MSTGIKDLKVWQEAVALAADAIRAVHRASRRETRAFTDQILLAAASLPIRIADGYGRYGTVEQRHCYRNARRALYALETHLAIARQAGLIPAATFTQLSSRSAGVGRLLAGYLSYVDRQITAEAEARAPAAARAPAEDTSASGS